METQPPKIETPVNWLWHELETLLPLEQLEPLRTGYQRQAHFYRFAGTLRHARRELAVFTRALEQCHPSRQQYWADRIERCKARIIRLERIVRGNQ